MEKNTHKTGGRRASGTKGQSQAGSRKATGAPAKSSGGRSRSGGTRKPSGGKGQSQDAGVNKEPQGASTMSQHAPMFGGTMQVAIEEVAMSSRGGRKQGPEPYPFGELPPSRVDGGSIIGPSFFIPEAQNPKKIIAAGRKRHKGAGKVFLTRQMEGPSIEDKDKMVPGTRVWLAPANYNQ